MFVRIAVRVLVPVRSGDRATLSGVAGEPTARLTAQMNPANSRATAVINEDRAVCRAGPAPDSARSAATAPSRRSPARRAARPQPGQLLPADARRMAIAPGALHQNAPCPTVAGLGDAAAPDPVAGGMLARHQAQLGHQLARAGKRVRSPISASNVVAAMRSRPRSAISAVTTSASDQSGTAAWIACSSRIRARRLGAPPAASPRTQCAVRDARASGPPARPYGPWPTFSCRDSAGRAAAAAPRPAGAWIALVDRRPAGADEITHRLVPRIRHPDRGQIAGAQQPGQGQRIAPIGLHPIAGLLRDQRRRHHDAVVAEALDQPIQPIAGRPGFIAERQPAMLRRKLLHQLARRRLRVRRSRRDSGPRRPARPPQSPPHSAASMYPMRRRLRYDRPRLILLA